MPAYRSPTLKPTRFTHDHHPSLSGFQSFFRYKSRSAYALLALLIIYLWYSSSLPLLSYRAPIHAPSLIYKNVDWTRYAYSFYATDTAYLCNALMVYESLSRLGSKADRVLVYPQEWDLEIQDGADRDSQLLLKARDELDVKLIPADVPEMKFQAWSLTQYDRILQFDTDVTLLQHMDGLFLAPRAPAAMIRSHQESPLKDDLAESLLLLEPSELEYERIISAARSRLREAKNTETHIMNRLFGDSCMVLPRRGYGLLSEEFRAQNHARYLGNDHEVWDPEKALNEASLVRFSDDPLPKPWTMWPHNLIGEIMPKCKIGRLGDDDCRDKKIWTELYDDFKKRRKVSKDS